MNRVSKTLKKMQRHPVDPCQHFTAQLTKSSLRKKIFCVKYSQTGKIANAENNFFSDFFQFPIVFCPTVTCPPAPD
jgi:hypothetical protein